MVDKKMTVQNPATSAIIFLSFIFLFATGALPRIAAEETVAKYAADVLQDRPVAYWRFEDSKFETHPKSEGHGKIGSGVPLRLFDEDDLNDASAESKGFVRAGQPDPRPERFLAFEPGNRAVQFQAPTVIKIRDHGQKSLLDFDLDDAITLEAWVSVKRLGDGQQIYIVGKGRTKNPVRWKKTPADMGSVPWRQGDPARVGRDLCRARSPRS